MTGGGALIVLGVLLGSDDLVGRPDHGHRGDADADHPGLDQSDQRRVGIIIGAFAIVAIAAALAVGLPSAS